MSIEENYKRVQDGIADACATSGRNTNEITLIAVTKFVPIERIAPAIALGVRSVGENRAQELTQKMDFFRSNDCSVHFIGQLQTNKVKYIIGQADLVQSVDRIQLAQEMERLAANHSIVQDILVEVNIGHEVQKGGIEESNLQEFLSSMSDMPHLQVKGLMCVPPAVDEQEAIPYFARMRKLFEQCKGIPGVNMQHLSMGMSGDYGAAIREGATMVRVGSALFGARMQTGI